MGEDDVASAPLIEDGDGDGTRADASPAVAANSHPDDPIAEQGRLHSMEEDGTAAAAADMPSLRFLQDEGAWRRFKWVPYWMRRLGIAAGRWSAGPPNPRDFRIEPLFPAVQHAPLWLLDRVLPRPLHQAWLFVAYIGLWILTFALVMRQGTFATEIEGWGAPGDIGCGNTYWVPGNQCGIDGNDCRPFNGTGFAFRCPANCADYQVLNYRAVGDQEVIYRPMVIGGPPDRDSDAGAVYRGDSYICGAAVHAGVVSNAAGGCGVVRLVGRHDGYVSSDRHGIESVGFDFHFPLSFTFQGGVACEAKDMRWSLLAVSVVFTAVLSLFTTSPALFFFTIFTGVFWTVGLASDPPPHWSLPGLFSNIVGKYLPAMLAAWVMYDKMGVRRTLAGLTAQVEKTVLWVGACWFGALENYTFRWIPIQRLTPHDLEQQPGARFALAMIIILLVLIAAKQVYYLRQEGRLIAYLKLYILFVAGLMACLVLPDLQLRIHHYVLALLLLPGVGMQTRPALLYQGLLVGLFINGIARWGWDPVLQTAAALQGDAAHNSPLPSILAPAVELGANLSTITFRWDAPPGPRYDGISVLVNDVERFRAYFDESSGSGSGIGGEASDRFVWTRKADAGLNEYFRFGFMEGSRSWDYTRAGIWDASGDWVDMQPGPSRIMSRSLDGEARLADLM